MISWVITIARITVSAIAIWLAFWFLPDIEKSVNILTLLAVGFVGFISWLSHFVFYKSDAKRLGFENQNPAFQWEVGFANMAFAVIALLSFFGNWGLAAEVAIVLGFSLYLLQAALLHIYTSIKKEKSYKGHFLLSVVGTLLIVFMLLYFCICRNAKKPNVSFLNLTGHSV